MHITGALFQTMDIIEGAGKNGPWKKREFIIETQEKYPKKICFSAWNEQAADLSGFAPGSMLEVHFDLSSREYNGRWYTDIKAWKIMPAGQGASGPPSGQSYGGGQQGYGGGQQGYGGGQQTYSGGGQQTYSGGGAGASEETPFKANDDLPF
jgi:hypothetical protein